MSVVIFVRTEDIPKLPGAMQQYIEDYFQPSTMLGIPVMTCKEALHWDAVSYNFFFRQKAGVGPMHNVDLQGYREGLDGEGLNTWMYKHPELVHFVYADPRCDRPEDAGGLEDD